MKRLIAYLFISLLTIVSAIGQSTVFNNSWTYGNEIKARAYSLELVPSENRAYVTIEFQALKKMKRLCLFYDETTLLRISEWMHLLGAINSDGSIISVSPYSNTGWDKPVVGQSYYLKLAFTGTIYPGATSATLSSGNGIFTFNDLPINNPMKYTSNLKTESSIKQFITDSKNPLAAIYEEVGGERNILALTNDGWGLKMIFIKWGLKDVTYANIWKTGDIAANNFRQTASGIFKCDWLIPNQNSPEDAYIAFDGGGRMSVVYNNKEHIYLKTFPANSNSTPYVGTPSQGSVWTGTGWSILGNYVVTNYHVVDGAKTIIIKGVNGNFFNKVSAEVVATDKINDLAILKLKNVSVTNVPYSVVTRQAEVGDDVFILGYPMTDTMGEEVKLTTGVISARSGFEGNVANYQISAPIQPGNSGGPMFNSKGQVVGIAVAKHSQAELASYAIKTSYLQNLIESSIGRSLLPSNNTISTMSLSGQVKAVKNFVYLIMCSDSPNYNF